MNQTYFQNMVWKKLGYFAASEVQIKKTVFGASKLEWIQMEKGEMCRTYSTHGSDMCSKFWYRRVREVFLDTWA